MKRTKKTITVLLCTLLVLSFPLSIFAETIVIKENGRVITIEIGETEFTESLTMNALQSVQPDMSLRPETNPWTDKINNMWGVGLNGVNHNDVEVIESEDHPYTLVGNGLCSRIMVQFNNVIPRSMGENEDPEDPEIFKIRSIDVPGQYKLKDKNGNVYYTYCVDVATDANLRDTYNGVNVEDADYYSSSEAAHIRYICLHGYWGAEEGLGSMDYFVNILINEGVLTPEEVETLTPGEAMTATQAAIWSFGNSDLSFTVDSDIVVGPALNSYSFRALDWEWLEDYVSTNNKIKKMFDFLVQGTMESSSETTLLTRTNAINDIQVKVNEKISDDGDLNSEVYSVDISFTMGTEVFPDDNLNVSLMQDDTTVAEMVLEPGEKSYTFKNIHLTENSEVTFKLDGSREMGMSVFLFEAPDPTVSQTLVGVAYGTQYVGLKRGLSFDVKVQSPHTNGKDDYIPWITMQVFAFAFLISAFIALPKYVCRKRS